LLKMERKSSLSSTKVPLLPLGCLGRPHNLPEVYNGR
jgi:hypothetical protein